MLLEQEFELLLSMIQKGEIVTPQSLSLWGELFQQPGAIYFNQMIQNRNLLDRGQQLQSFPILIQMIEESLLKKYHKISSAKKRIRDALCRQFEISEESIEKEEEFGAELMKSHKLGG